MELLPDPNATVDPMNLANPIPQDGGQNALLGDVPQGTRN